MPVTVVSIDADHCVIKSVENERQENLILVSMVWHLISRETKDYTAHTPFDLFGHGWEVKSMFYEGLMLASIRMRQLDLFSERMWL